MSALYVMIGLPGSGKSTYAEALAEAHDALYLSSDLIRLELFDDINYQGQNFKVFQTMRERAKEALDHGVNVVYDATNLIAGRRIQLLNYLKPDEAYAYYMATPVEECIERDKQRDRTVGKRVIYHFVHNAELPDLSEGWTDVYMV